MLSRIVAHDFGGIIQNRRRSKGNHDDREQKTQREAEKNATQD